MTKHSYSSRISQSSERDGDETTSLKLTDQVQKYYSFCFNDDPNVAPVLFYMRIDSTLTD